MAASAQSIPPSVPWMMWKTLKGTYGGAASISPVELRGKWVLISGANNGVGREAAIQFASWGASLILVCRQPPAHETHPEKVVEECRTAGGDNKDQIIEWWECDMGDLSSVEAIANRWNKTGRPLDILMNNAGTVPSAKAPLTKDGFEICHQVNFLSHTLLTLGVLPSIAKAPSPRIVCTTSCMHYLGKYNLANANVVRDGYPNNKLYFQIWLSELQLRLLQHPDYDHIVVHGVHPGYVVSGIWQKGIDMGFSLFLKDPINWMMIRLLAWFGISCKDGALALVYAATAPENALQQSSADAFKGGAKYINRIWEDVPNPYVRHDPTRKEVWGFILGELGANERTSISDEVKKTFCV